jgi:hypothetical protein
MLKQLLKPRLKPKAKASPMVSDSLNYLSTGYSVMPSSPPLVVTGIWQRYRLGAVSEKELLQGLSKQVAELKVPQSLIPLKFQMATHLACAPCASKLETADVIEALMDWADDNGITVVDGATA